MDEAEQLCDRLVVINDGVVIARGSPQELIAEHVARDVVEVRFRRSTTPDVASLRALFDGRARSVEVVADRALVATDDAGAIQREVDHSDLQHTGVLTRRATLEDVFLALTGRKLIE
jgi:lipooligosaccharide transport system ATP-binding protein